VHYVHAGATNLPIAVAIAQKSTPMTPHAIALDCVFAPTHAIDRVFLDLDLHAMCVVLHRVGYPLVFLLQCSFLIPLLLYYYHPQLSGSAML
jgi:hypothetical protein